MVAILLEKWVKSSQAVVAQPRKKGSLARCLMRNRPSQWKLLRLFACRCGAFCPWHMVAQGHCRMLSPKAVHS
eukprot:1954831-Amphidinium_carterae.1